MLLPSDVARLVLGYLQQEKLETTCRAFIAESPSLKEYAEHYSEEVSVPGCLLSLFGKSLTTILNEYVLLKSKEIKEKSKNEMPVMLSSLWKKLDHTLSQIRCMQDSAAFHTCQRARTRHGIENIRRQRSPFSPLASYCSSLPRRFGQQTSTPISTPQIVLRPLTAQGVTQAVANPLFAGQSTIQSTSSLVSESNGETLQVVSIASSEKKQTSVHSSPVKRKNDNQRRRRAAVASSSATVASSSAAAATISIVTAQERNNGQETDPLQELIDANFPQMVIENAREKILSNKSLQEKLAENINKFLGSDSSALTSKPADNGAVEPEASIDEILGLQGGEMHMSEEAIHDILTQTELDPDFQELYDLFALGTTKPKKNVPCDPTPAAQGGGQTGIENLDNVMELDDTTTCNPTDVHPEQRESENAMSSLKCVTGGTALKRTDATKTSLLTCENSKTSAGDQNLGPEHAPKSADDGCNLDITGNDDIMDPTIEPHNAESEPALSQSQDAKLRNKPFTDVNEIKNHVKTTTAIIGEKIKPNSKLKQSKESVVIDCRDVEIVESHSFGPQQESNRTLEQPLKNVIDLESTEAPVCPGVNPEGGKDKLLEVITIPSDTDDSIEETTAELLPDKRTTSAKHPKAQKKLFSTISEVKVPTPTSMSTATAVISPSQQNSHLVCVESCVTSDSANVMVASAPSSNIAVSVSSSQISDKLNVVVDKVITVTKDTELVHAVTKPPDCTRTEVSNSSSVEVVADPSLPGNESHAVSQPKDLATSTVNNKTNHSSDGIIQLVPSTSSTFGPTNSIFISTCVTNKPPGKPSNIMMLPSSSGPVGNQKQPCIYQTPPRQGSVYTVGKAISPKISQGSTIILASPVQSMLQGIVGMFPVSVVGQSGSTTFQAPSHQVVRVPVPKLPLPPKSQKPAAPRSQTNAGKPATNPIPDSTSHPSSLRVQRGENTEKPIAIDVQEKLLPDTTNLSIKVPESHRRVLCFDTSTITTVTSNIHLVSNTITTKMKDHNEAVCTVVSSAPVCSSVRAILPKDSRKPDKTAVMVTNSRSDVTATFVPFSVVSKEIAAEKIPEAGGSSDDLSGAVANKENLLQMEIDKEGTSDSHKKPASQEGAESHGEKTVHSGQEASKKQMLLPNIIRRTPRDPKKSPAEKSCLTSPLTKQASDILQGIQFQSPNAKRLGGDDLPIPRTPGGEIENLLEDEPSDPIRTPVTKRYGSDGGTPKPMLPPATPEIPACSPASETGSENSVSMAAHTLMILSRASLAKTGTTPPKNTQQLKSSRKRKLEELKDSEIRSHKTDIYDPAEMLKKKKIKKHRKKGVDSFPTGMDVDKFLMSLHYDE